MRCEKKSESNNLSYEGNGKLTPAIGETGLSVEQKSNGDSVRSLK